MAAPLRMARVALLFVAIVIAMNPGAHGFITNPNARVTDAAANGFATSEELKALIALVESQYTLQQAQVSRLEEAVADISTMVVELTSRSLEAPISADEPSDDAQVSWLEETVANISTMVLELTTKPAEAPISATSLGNGLVPGADVVDEDDDDEDEHVGILDLPPRLIAGMQDLQLILPVDWECQTGTAGGVYPCPDGIPSTCSLNRYKFDLGEGAGLSESCAACFCLLNTHTCCQYIDDQASKCQSADACGGGNLEGWKESATIDCSFYASSPKWCTDGPGSGMDPHASITAAEACAVCHSPEDQCYGASYNVPSWASSTDGSGCASFTANPHWCHNVNVDTNTGITVKNACAACRKRVFGSCSSKFTEPVWGGQWWDEDKPRSYLNFKITRYEMGPTMGIEFYSTEGDTVKVYPSGKVHFKPKNAKRTLVVNEQVLYDMDDPGTARARVLSTGPLNIPHAAPDLNLPLSDMQIQQMRADLRSAQEPMQIQQMRADLGSAQEPELYDRRNTRASRAKKECGRGGCVISTSAVFRNVGGQY